MAELAFILLGSNQRPEENLPAAVRGLSDLGCVRCVSRVFQSPPANGDGPDYLNAAVMLETDLTFAELRERLKALETRLGRVRGRAAEVAIDLDLCMAASGSGEVPPDLPSPETLTRAYVAAPLAELAPELAHPRTGEPLRAIAARLAAARLRPRPDVDLFRALTTEGRGPRSPGSGRNP